MGHSKGLARSYKATYNNPERDKMDGSGKLWVSHHQESQINSIRSNGQSHLEGEEYLSVS